MKSKKLTIKIDKPVSEVFEFVTNPENTPKWIDFMAHEETNEWPAKLGTVYKNQNQEGEWGEYDMTKFEQDKMFVMSKRDSGYHVRYRIKPLGEDSCELEYYEWMDEGELDPFPIKHLK